MRTPSEPEPGGKRAWGTIDHAAMLFALIFPTVLTWAYFIALEDSLPWLQRGAYGIGKVIQFAFPILFVLLVRKERLRFRAPNRAGLLLGIAFGLAVLVAMLALYHFWLRSAVFFTGPVAEEIQHKIAAFGVKSAPAYSALAVFYVLVHSLLEEYYWRLGAFWRLPPRVSP